MEQKMRVRPSQWRTDARTGVYTARQWQPRQLAADESKIIYMKVKSVYNCNCQSNHITSILRQKVYRVTVRIALFSIQVQLQICEHMPQYSRVMTCFSFYALQSAHGVEPDVTHQTSWLGSTGGCGVPQHHVGEYCAQKRAQCPAVGNLDKTEKSVGP